MLQAMRMTNKVTEVRRQRCKTVVCRIIQKEAWTSCCAILYPVTPGPVARLAGLKYTLLSRLL